MPTYLNLPRSRQRELSGAFFWLPSVADGQPIGGVQSFSVSFFDHWLSEREADALLNNVSTEEVRCRDKKHRSFCEKLLAETEVLSFRLRGRKQDQVRFRAFPEKNELLRYLTERTAKGEYNFHVVLPLLRLAYFSGYDDTSHVYCVKPGNISLIRRLAEDSGLHVLQSAG